MSTEKVARFFDEKGLVFSIIEMPQSTATVPLPLRLWEWKRPASPSLWRCVKKEKDIVLVTCGTARLDNKKYKAPFFARQDAFFRGHSRGDRSSGGRICPFGLPDGSRFI
jgi:hypothetical protein